MTSGPDLDVVVVGDGPAGCALASACVERGLRALLVGSGDPWPATYGIWRDDVPWLGDDVFGTTADRVVVHGERRHVLDRPYGVVDNAALRAHLLRSVELRSGVAVGTQHFGWGARVVLDDGAVDARCVVDATGPGGTLLRSTVGGRHRPAFQTAYGVMLSSLPDGFDSPPDAVTLMDLRDAPAAATDGLAAPSFGYIVPVGGGWLVEETVLAARPRVDPDRLRERLVARLGPEGPALVTDAEAAGCTEVVSIALDVATPDRHQAVAAFGAAAGFVHPASGYSVAASLRSADAVAAAIAERRDPWDEIWPARRLRTRALHDIGLDVLLGLDAPSLRAFFDAFFDQPVETWRDYLRLDADPADVARAMRAVFSAAPWSLRRRLMRPGPATRRLLTRR